MMLTSYKMMTSCEPFSQWLEEKIDLPLFEDFSMDTSITTNDNITGFTKRVQQCNTTPLQHEYDTQSLLKEFQYVYDTVGMNHLTPPQSPPASNSNASFYPQQSNLQSTYTNLVVPTNNELIVVNSPQVRHPVDVQQELADVEELVRSRAQDIIPGDESDLLSSWMTDRDDEEEGDVASPASDSTSSSDRDDDWVPQQLVIRSTGKGRANKPYARSGTEDRRSRKKEQNKNAATRYRQKKKAQIEEILGEEKGLLDRNEELKSQCDDVQREIKYLKGLMRDLFKAKGLI